MGKSIILVSGLYGFWLLLSGYWHDPLLVGAGVFCAAGVVLLARRMGIVDHEGVPWPYFLRLCLYGPWLAGQVVLSNIAVARAILHPRTLSPTLRAIPVHLKSDFGRVLYANSITLTPGTISVDMGEDAILVHALQVGGIHDLEGGGMEARVRGVEGA